MTSTLIGARPVVGYPDRHAGSRSPLRGDSGRHRRGGDPRVYPARGGTHGRHVRSTRTRRASSGSGSSPATARSSPGLPQQGDRQEGHRRSSGRRRRKVVDTTASPRRRRRGTPAPSPQAPNAGQSAPGSRLTSLQPSTTSTRQPATARRRHVPSTSARGRLNGWRSPPRRRRLEPTADRPDVGKGNVLPANDGSQPEPTAGPTTSTATTRADRTTGRPESDIAGSRRQLPGAAP